MCRYCIFTYMYSCNAVKNGVNRKPGKARRQQNKLVFSQIYFNPKQSVFYVYTADNLPEMLFYLTAGFLYPV